MKIIISGRMEEEISKRLGEIKINDQNENPLVESQLKNARKEIQKISSKLTTLLKEKTKEVK